MAQFDVHRNPDAATRDRYPYLLDVQSDLVSVLATRVVIPLCPDSELEGGPISVLTPVVEVAGRRHAILTPEQAGIPSRHLGETVANLAGHRAAIIAAIDLLFTGF
jgi:toxin CcdB